MKFKHLFTLVLFQSILSSKTENLPNIYTIIEEETISFDDTQFIRVSSTSIDKTLLEVLIINNSEDYPVKIGECSSPYSEKHSKCIKVKIGYMSLELNRPTIGETPKNEEEYQFIPKQGFLIDIEAPWDNKTIDGKKEVPTEETKLLFLFKSVFGTYTEVSLELKKIVDVDFDYMFMSDNEWMGELFDSLLNKDILVDFLTEQLMLAISISEDTLPEEFINKSFLEE